MFIERVDIGSYRHLENISLGPFLRPGDASDLLVLAGPNGGGKSSVLELISLALSNMYSLTYSLNRTSPTSSFEVTIGLLPNELDLIRHQAEQPGSSLPKPAVDYILEHRSYRRSFQYPQGEYAKDQTIHNQVHDLVLNVLRGSWTRPLGFHLAADRSYQKAPYKRDLLFEYSKYTKHDYVWSYAFQNSTAQYKDMFDFLVTWRYHFTRILGSYYQQKEAGLLADPNQPPPRDEYGAILRRVFPGYEFIDTAEDAPTDLHVKIPSGQVISFSDLSSGEKEVFFTLCFFQRHNVQEAVVIIDEPELHLHPSLARLLVRTMLALKPRNQIWLATQSSEIIDEAGRDKVAFIRRVDGTQKAEVVWAPDEETALSCLRDLFGQSGYIGLAKAMLFTEGRGASADRKMFSRLFPVSTRDIKIIPASGCSEVERINRAVLAILQSNLGWCRFFLLRDRDYMTDTAVHDVRARAGDNLFVLNRHEIENYLLDFEVISKVLHDLFDRQDSPRQVEERLKKTASNMAGEVLRDMVVFRLNQLFRPEDFSVPSLYQGELPYALGHGWPAKLDDLLATLRSRASTVVARLRDRVEGHNFDTVFEGCKTEVERALAEERWPTLFPGKELLHRFCSDMKLGKPPLLQNAIIKELSATPEKVPADLRSIIDRVVTQ